jgi:hypothetical protein
MDAIRDFRGAAALSDQLQVFDIATDAGAVQWCEDESRELLARGLATRCQGQKVLVLRHKDSVELSRSPEKVLVVRPASAVLLAGQYANTASSQSFRDCRRYVYVHVKLKRH